MATKTKSKRTQPRGSGRSKSATSAAKRSATPSRTGPRRVQGGRADTGRSRGEEQGRWREASGQRGDGKMGRRDGAQQEERSTRRTGRGRGFASMSPERRREVAARGGRASQRNRLRWEPARRGSGASQSGAGRWESESERGRSREARWDEGDYRSRRDWRERDERGMRGGPEAGDYEGPRRYRGEDYSDWRPGMPERGFPRGAQYGRRDAPYGEPQRDYRPQDWDYYSPRGRDYARTGRERYTADFRRAEGYEDEGVDRYGPGWRGQSEFRRDYEEERFRGPAGGPREGGRETRRPSARAGRRRG